MKSPHSQMMKRVFALCAEHEISLAAEHVAGDDMKEAAVDSLSRWSEFAVAAPAFNSLNKNAKFGNYKGAQGYTVDLRLR